MVFGLLESLACDVAEALGQAGGQRLDVLVGRWGE